MKNWCALRRIVLVAGCFLAAKCAISAELLPPTKETQPTARVVSVHHRGAVEAFRPQAGIVRGMVEQGITNLTGKASLAEAWRSLVSTQDIVGIKVYSTPGPHSGTRPVVVAAVIEGLLAAGLPAKQIVIWDKRSTDLRLAGFNDLAERYGVRVEGSAQAGYDEATFYESAIIGNLVWGDLEFGKKGAVIGRRSFISKLVAQELTKVINISPLLNHDAAGVSGCLFTMAVGSADNVFRFEVDAGRLAVAIPEIYALPVLSDRVVLSMVDALVCQYEGGERGLLHYSVPLNQLWFSRDPLALDTLSLKELEQRRREGGAPVVKPNTELYANAALLELGINDLKRIQVDRFKLEP